MLRPLLRAAWGADTCDPADLDEWRPDNPARGQCGVTALIVNDLLGGDLILGEVFVGETKVGHHYWNRLTDGTEVDLTADQFHPGEKVIGGQVLQRPLDAPRRCREQYELLRKRVITALNQQIAVTDHDREDHDGPAARALIAHIRSSEWLLQVLATVRDTAIPGAWAGAGVLRDLVWGSRFGTGFSPGGVHDVDVVFFDPQDLSRTNDDRVTEELHRRSPQIPWQARNQAAVHTWYAAKFGGAPVEPLVSVHDAVATWPETATAVAVRLRADNTMEICAPFGLADLLDGVWRRNPRRIGLQWSLERLARHRPQTRYPGVTVIPPE